ncbi:gamma carbonic anhydrase family protein [Elizabethkingia argentiflava]|uniref:Gamma carbonic anhydrase family protein n=1 Tax=Elizabethkingia argenteiflava TaxID=2681556 RepID=A0A845PX12_9FLAO|nr:transferase hexapeptide repeat family protein [Elizabethkingia argenteiflava]NAW51491.1 gamma carbonic anhydrase family protein [Elizabethkingia argenteiflava]
MNIYSYHGIRPVIKPSAYIHPQAVIIGHVEIGEEVYIGPQAVIRGDWGKILIKDGANVQENCTLHVFPNIETILEESAHIGHGAIIHSAHIGKNCLVGMNAVVMDKAVIGDECIIGALAFVPAYFKSEDRKLIVGSPAKVIRDVSDEMISWKTKGTQLYQELAREAKEAILPCEPLSEFKEQSPSKIVDYNIWQDVK